MNAQSVATSADGGFLITDRVTQRVRRIAPDGTIATIAGTGACGFSGDGGRARAAALCDPIDVAVAPDGALLVDDGRPARAARLGRAVAISVTPDAGFLIADARGRNSGVRFVAGSPLRVRYALTRPGRVSLEVISLRPNGTLV